MELKDIQKDKYYVAYYDDLMLDKIVTKSHKDSNFHNSHGISLRQKSYYSNNSWACKSHIRLAETEEIYWLDCCIKKNTYISYEEAMKLFNNESIKTGNPVELTKIYKRLLNIK